MKRKQRTVLAVGSAGGHWVQLRRLRPAWAGCRVAYVTTNPGYRPEVLEAARREEQEAPGFFAITDANRWQKGRLILQLAQIIAIALRVRPDVVVSTGAAPGYFALAVGKLLGARTIWVDSIANADELSLSGRKATTFADLYLTQWPHLAGSVDGPAGRPEHRGSVI